MAPVVEEPKKVASFTPAFFFRQRHGRLDWQVVANASLDRIIANVDVQALQKVVDPLTFSEVRTDDLPVYSPELLSKALQLLQLVVEYLLNYQEVQDDLVAGLREQAQEAKGRIKGLLMEVRRVEDERAAAGQTVFRYQAFVHICKRLLSAKGVEDVEGVLEDLWHQATGRQGDATLHEEKGDMDGWRPPLCPSTTRDAWLSMVQPPVSVHACDRCHKAFASLYYLRKHRKRRHGIEDEADEDLTKPSKKTTVDEGLERRVREAVAEEGRRIEAVVDVLRTELERAHEALRLSEEGRRQDKAQADAHYHSLLERKSEELRGVEEELGKARAERDWNHARLADANKELDELRRLLREATEARQHEKPQPRPLTSLQRLTGAGKSRLQLEGEKRHKARVLLKAYQGSFTSLRSAWFQWVARDLRAAQRGDRPKQPSDKPHKTLLTDDRIRELKEKYAKRRQPLTAPHTPSSSSPPPLPKPTMAPLLDWRDYMDAFERHVALTVERQLGDEGHTRKPDGKYDRSALERARAGVMERLEARAELLGVAQGDQLPTPDMQRSLRELSVKRREHALLDAGAAQLKAQLDQLMNTTGTEGASGQEGINMSQILDGTLAKSMGAATGAGGDTPKNAQQALQAMLQQYVQAVQDSTVEDVEFPAEEVISYLAAMQTHGDSTHTHTHRNLTASMTETSASGLAAPFSSTLDMSQDVEQYQTRAALSSPASPARSDAPAVPPVRRPAPQNDDNNTAPRPSKHNDAPVVRPAPAPAPAPAPEQSPAPLPKQVTAVSTIVPPLRSLVSSLFPSNTPEGSAAPSARSYQSAGSSLFMPVSGRGAEYSPGTSAPSTARPCSSSPAPTATPPLSARPPSPTPSSTPTQPAPVAKPVVDAGPSQGPTSMEAKPVEAPVSEDGEASEVLPFSNTADSSFTALEASKPPKPTKSTPSPRDDVVEAFPTDKTEPQPTTSTFRPPKPQKTPSPVETISTSMGGGLSLSLPPTPTASQPSLTTPRSDAPNRLSGSQLTPTKPAKKTPSPREDEGLSASESLSATQAASPSKPPKRTPSPREDQVTPLTTTLSASLSGSQGLEALPPKPRKTPSPQDEDRDLSASQTQRPPKPMRTPSPSPRLDEESFGFTASSPGPPKPTKRTPSPQEDNSVKALAATGTPPRKPSRTPSPQEEQQGTTKALALVGTPPRKPSRTPSPLDNADKTTGGGMAASTPPPKPRKPESPRPFTEDGDTVFMFTAVAEASTLKTKAPVEQRGGGATEATAIEPFDVSLDEDWDDAIEPATERMDGADQAVKHTVGEGHKTHIEAGEDEVQGFDDETEVEVIDL